MASNVGHSNRSLDGGFANESEAELGILAISL